MGQHVYEWCLGLEVWHLGWSTENMTSPESEMKGPRVVNSELKYTLAYTHTHTHTHIHYTDIETGLCTPQNQPREPLIPCSHERTSCELLHNG